jgi:hypothetical protein
MFPGTNGNSQSFSHGSPKPRLAYQLDAKSYSSRIPREACSAYRKAPRCPIGSEYTPGMSRGAGWCETPSGNGGVYGVFPYQR